MCSRGLDPGMGSPGFSLGLKAIRLFLGGSFILLGKSLRLRRRRGVRINGGVIFPVHERNTFPLVWTWLYSS